MKISMTRYAGHADHDAQREAMLKDLLPAVNQIAVLRNRVLVATYQRSDKSSGGILLPPTVTDEGRYQGKAGLVLKIGPVAFLTLDEIADDLRKGFEFDNPEGEVDQIRGVLAKHNVPFVGDWVFFRASDTWDCGISVGGGEGVHCRFVTDDCIIGRIDNPTLIW
jgi:hypothetical protein